MLARLVGPQHLVVRDVEGTPRGVAVQDRGEVGTAHVVGVDHLQTQARRQRDDRQHPGSQDRPGHERTEEVPCDLGPGVGLEDQRGSQPRDDHLRVGGLDVVENPLLRCFVHAVVRGRDTTRRPGLVAQFVVDDR